MTITWESQCVKLKSHLRQNSHFHTFGHVWSSQWHPINWLYDQGYYSFKDLILYSFIYTITDVWKNTKYSYCHHQTSDKNATNLHCPFILGKKKKQLFYQYVFEIISRRTVSRSISNIIATIPLFIPAKTILIKCN